MNRTLKCDVFRMLRSGLAFAALSALCAGGQADSILEIDGVKFTAAELAQRNGKAVFQARNSLFEAEKKATEEFITDYLLERQAKKEGLTVEKLLEKHAWVKLPAEPGDEALRFYYDGLDLTEPLDAVRDKIRDTVRERRKANLKKAYVQTLRDQSNVIVRVAPPRAPIQVGDAPIRGAERAAVTIIEYADYECPYCQQIKPVVDQLEKDYKGKIAFAFKDVPLPMHANAQKAAEATHCAGAQGKFWEFHERLYATRQYSVPELKEHARALKLDPATFNLCLDSGAQAERIKAHVQEAQSIGLPGTPGFFINGRFLSGAIDYQAMRQVIEEELRMNGGAEAGTAALRRQ